MPDVDVQVTREDDVVLDVVGLISYSMVLCSVFVPDVDVQVTREDDVVLGVVGLISYSMVLCSVFVLLIADIRITREDDGSQVGLKKKFIIWLGAVHLCS